MVYVENVFSETGNCNAVYHGVRCIYSWITPFSLICNLSSLIIVRKWLLFIVDNACISNPHDDFQKLNSLSKWLADIKSPLSGLTQSFTIENPLKWWKMVFIFIFHVESFFGLWDIYIYILPFCLCRKTAWLEC